MLTKIFFLNKWKLKAESSDFVKKPKTLVTEREIDDYLSQENGMIRLKRAFDTSNGNLSPEVQFYFDNYANKSSAQVIFIVSSVYIFHKNRKHLQTKPTMQLYTTLFKDAVLFSVKYFTVFALCFGITETIAVYRNKTSPWEFGFVGALMGLHNGIRYDLKPKELPKNMANKAPLKPVTRLVAIRNCTIGGAVTGLLFGALLTYLKRTEGMSQEKRHFWNVHNKLQKEREHEFGLHQAVDRNNDGWYETS